MFPEIRFNIRLGEKAMAILTPGSREAVTYNGPDNLRLFKVGRLK